MRTRLETAAVQYWHVFFRWENPGSVEYEVGVF